MCPEIASYEHKYYKHKFQVIILLFLTIVLKTVFATWFEALELNVHS